MQQKIAARSNEREEALFSDFTAAERERFGAFLSRLDERARLLLDTTGK